MENLEQPCTCSQGALLADREERLREALAAGHAAADRSRRAQAVGDLHGARAAALVAGMASKEADSIIREMGFLP
jgi:hypothetical protein